MPSSLIVKEPASLITSPFPLIPETVFGSPNVNRSRLPGVPGIVAPVISNASPSESESLESNVDVIFVSCSVVFTSFCAVGGLLPAG